MDSIADLGVPFFVLDIRAGRAAMLTRLRARNQAGADASDAGIEVLAWQMGAAEPLDAAEPAIVVETEGGLGPAQVRMACAPILAPLGQA